MSVFVTLHDSIASDDLEDVLLMVIDDLVEGGGKDTEEVVVSYGNLPTGWAANGLSTRVLLFDVPLADAELLRASAAFALGEVFRLEVSVDESWKLVYRTARHSDELNLDRTESLLSNGFPRPALELAGATRRYLQEQRRPFPASLADGIRRHMLLSDCVERCRTPTFPDEGDVLCKRGIDTDLAFFLATHSDNLRNLVKEQPDFVASLDGQIKFLNEGANLIKVAFKAASPQYAVFVWLSIYLLRLSYLRYSINDTAEGMALLARSLECYSTYYLAEARVIRFESGAFVWNAGDKKVLGTGQLWAELLNRIDTSTAAALSPAIAAVEAMIKLRNRSIYGHGVQKVTKQVFESYYSNVRQILERLEADDPMREARWTRLWQLSTPSSLSVLRAIVSKALEEFQRHGNQIYP